MPAGIFAGIAVHILTASGAVCGLIALHHAAAHSWPSCFLWLGVAAIIDTIDGPIARKVRVTDSLPRFSGARLDLVVDYLNYCAVPAFVVMASGRAGEGFGAIAAAVILLSSLFHFADLESKTADGFFIGFPAIWNVVCLYVFVFDPGPTATFAIVLVLAVLTFVPVKWVHPVRVRKWRGLTLAMTLMWSAAAIYEVAEGFPGELASRIVFAIVAVYLLAVGLSRTFDLAGFGPISKD